MGILIGEKESKKWGESGTNRIACMDHGNLSIQRSRNDKRTDRSSTGCSPEKEPGKVKGMDSHKMASVAIGYLAGGKIGTCISFWR